MGLIIFIHLSVLQLNRRILHENNHEEASHLGNYNDTTLSPEALTGIKGNATQILENLRKHGGWPLAIADARLSLTLSIWRPLLQVFILFSIQYICNRCQ